MCTIMHLSIIYFIFLFRMFEILVVYKMKQGMLIPDIIRVPDIIKNDLDS